MIKIQKLAKILIVGLIILGVASCAMHVAEDENTGPSSIYEKKDAGGQKSRAMKKPTYDQIKSAIAKKGYKFFTGHLNINIIAIRGTSRIANKWDDMLCIVYQENGKNIIKCYPYFTTDPGTYYLQHPLTSRGCAIVKPGQYRGLYKIGLHKGYKALQQKSNITVYRDNNKDNYLDMYSSTLETGMYGINLHHGNYSSTIGKYSAGCQVLKYPSHLTQVLEICEASKKIFGNSFTYTLLDYYDVF